MRQAIAQALIQMLNLKSNTIKMHIYRIQYSAFTMIDYAYETSRKLSNHNIDNYILRFKVIAGSYTLKVNAEIALKNICNLGFDVVLILS